MDQFARRKGQQFIKQDRSSKGDFDQRITKLCDKLNKKLQYYTTSSCSGRIALVKEPLSKKPGLIAFRTHDKITFAKLKNELEKLEQNEKENVVFKQEPCVLVVACKTMDDASDLLDQAREKAGWKNSGIMSLKKRILCELRGTETLAFPIINKGKLVVGDEFLKILVKEANSRLERTWKKIKKLEKLI